MGYSRPHIRQALAAAREAGRPVDGLIAGDRATTLQLERWGFLPIDVDAMDKRVQDWYISQGLAVRDSDTPDTPDTPQPRPVGVSEDAPAEVALEAAEAALAAASAALRLARSIAS